MTRRYTLFVLAALIAALALSACTGGPTPPPSGKSFIAAATEFAFSPNTFTVKVGEETTFVVTNKGTLEHNFVVFDPSGTELARVTIKVGESASVTLKPAAAGAYLIDCDIPGHKEAGMTATLTVNP
jgi:uncharacterized cupredoxin-like copper-binding protein